MSMITRRRFLATSAAATAAMTLASSRVLGANDDIRVGIIGTGGRGGDLMNQFHAVPGVRIVALCDADSKAANQRAEALEKKGAKAQVYTDARKLLESKEVDAVVTAAPNHWHSLLGIWACQAGKDIYVEKPISHSIWEGRKLVEAAAKYNRIVQGGTQARSDKTLKQVFAELNAGAFGKILSARCLCYKPRAPIGKVSSPTPIPSNVDYNLWCGPAPMVPLMRERLHYDWHWVWPTGNGDFGNQGVHEADMCRWALGYNYLPQRVMSVGGRFWEDDGETFNAQIAFFDYPIPIISETRNMNRAKGDKVTDHYKGVRIGIVIQCENGYYAGGSSGGWTYDKDDKKVKQYAQDGTKDHMANFITACRSRKLSDIKASAEDGHLSAALCHMANISNRVGKSARPEEVTEVVKGNAVNAETFDRLKSHIQANEPDLSKTPLLCGPTLTMDNKTERFTGDFAEQANALVKDTYRAPFVVPEQV